MRFGLWLIAATVVLLGPVPAFADDHGPGAAGDDDFNVSIQHVSPGEVLASNEAVWKLHESFGFRQEAHFRDHVFKNGEWQDVLGLGLLKQDWAEHRAGARQRLAAKGYTPAD